jgi:hypothetical protein
MGNYEVDTAGLRRAQAELGDQLHDLRRHLNAAGDLINSVPPSTASKPDLVANKMHELYRDAADSDTGLRGVLEDYIAELEEMVALLDASVRAYESHDEEAIRRLQLAYGGRA